MIGLASVTKVTGTFAAGDTVDLAGVEGLR